VLKEKLDLLQNFSRGLLGFISEKAIFHQKTTLPADAVRGPHQQTKPGTLPWSGKQRSGYGLFLDCIIDNSLTINNLQKI